MFKRFFISFVIVSAFAFALPALADQTISVTTSGGQYRDTATNVSGGYGCWTPTQDFTTDNITESIGAFNTPSGPYNLQIYSIAPSCSGAATLLATSQNISGIANGSYNVVTAQFSSPFTFVNGTTYRIVYQPGAGNLITDVVQSGNARPTLGSITPSISWLAPTDGSHVTDFKYFNFQGSHFATSSGISYQVNVEYNTPTLGVLYDWEDNTTLYDSNTATPNVNVVKNHTLYLPQYASSTPWSARATLYQTTIASSGLAITEQEDQTPYISFTVASATSTPFAENVIPPKYDVFLNPESSSTSAFFVDCSAYDNASLFSSGTIPGWFCGIKKTTLGIIGWGIVPPPETMQSFKDALDFSDVLPLNIVYGVKNRIDIAGTWTFSATSTTPIAPLNLSDPNGNNLTNLISTSTFRDGLKAAGKCNDACANGDIALIQRWGNVVIWVGVIFGSLKFFL